MLHSLQSVIASVCLCTASSCLCAQEQHGHIRVGPSALPTPTGGEEGHGTLIGLAFPIPLQRSTLETWRRTLQLSDGQMVFLESLYDAYRQDDAALRDELLTPLWDWSASLGAVHQELRKDLDLAEDFTRMMRAASDAVQEIVRAEKQWLFDPLTAILTDEQQTRLPKVRDRRLREVYSAGIVNLHLAAVDLWKLVDDLQQRAQIDVANREATNALLSTYESSLTVLYQRRERADREALARVLLFGAQANAGLIEQNVARQRSNRLRAAAARAEESIANLNEMYVPLLAEHLMPESRAYFIDRYRLLGHPQVYPNPYDLRDVFHEAFMLEGLSETQAAGLTGIYEMAAMRDEMIADRMIDAVRGESKRFRTTRAGISRGGGEREDPFRVALDTATQERRRIAEETLEMLVDVLGSQQRDAMQPVIEQFWEFTENFQPRDWGPATSYFPAYPYGPAMPRYTAERRERMREFYYLLYPSQQPADEHDDADRTPED